MNRFRLTLYSIILSTFCLLICHCTFALTPKTTLEIFPNTNSEFFRFNLIYGEVQNLYGLNIGTVNKIKERMIGVQIGIFNKSSGQTTGLQLAVVNVSGEKLLGIQIGLVNYIEGGSAGLQAGIINLGKDRSSGVELTIGLVNYKTGSLTIGISNFLSKGINVALYNQNVVGFNFGILNLYSEGISLGIFNIGNQEIGDTQIGLINLSNVSKKSTVQFGLLNVCRGKKFSITTGINHCV
ncbi:hypothetical protein B1J93_13000 [Leptospira kirschneri serovar Pomona]|uniref:PPE family protein n=1 Tax=Leptospira kirschneri serovar Pomona TaxID=561005 RepID=A0A1T1DKQ8_9LEPT|nr:hypothetical protein [Leptospira kirschneri]OOV41478.1 hypothetical protein B1J93_13000 [Leptospira kirschneri serovar Pomona]